MNSEEHKPLDVGTWLTREGLNVAVKTAETSDERAARIRREEDDAKSERRKGEVLFYVSLGAVASLVLVSLYIAFLKHDAAAEEKQWARAMLTGATTALIAYMVGSQKAGKKP